MKIRRVRPERFGAMVATESPPALVAINRPLAKRVGIDGGHLWREPDPGLDVPMLEGPTEAHVAVTDRCPAGCAHCYAGATPEGHEPSSAELRERLDVLATWGTFSVAFGGGEGALREDLPELVAHARSLGLTPTLTTSGLGMTPVRARAFRGLAQVNVSWDGPTSVYREVRGYDGASVAERAIRCLREAGVPVGINTVLTRLSFDALPAIAEGAEALGAVELQLLRFKPSGRGRLDYLAQRMTSEQRRRLPVALREMSERHGFALRVDCAMVPFLAADPDVTLDSLRRFGVNGCEAGRSLVTVKSRGEVAPCSFWEEGSRKLTDQSWERDPALESFRRYVAEPPEPCASCPVQAVCRGGCRVVARHVNGDPWTPDPECPRVEAHREAQGSGEAHREAQGSGKPRTDAM